MPVGGWKVKVTDWDKIVKQTKTLEIIIPGRHGRSMWQTVKIVELIEKVGSRIRQAQIDYWKTDSKYRKNDIKKYIKRLEKERLDLITSVPFRLSEGTTSNHYWVVLGDNYYAEIDKKTFQRLKVRLNRNGK
jgi:hypothetical protein